MEYRSMNNVKERDLLQDLGIDRNIILIWTLEIRV